jgi:tetratricopeptide (TPR) repeat protein
LFEADDGPIVFPECGETVAGCRLVTELGRGAQGRVYLATQLALAGRPVVLKVGPRAGGEHLHLARLLHTHIVPIYFAQDDSARRLRVLGMPYLGGATLARVLAELRPRPPAARRGRDLTDALDRVSAHAAPAADPPGPARARLAGASYVAAACWLSACLAGGLHHAHERGLVHLDVKPANVLLAADGQPLLLDFHLARPPLAAGDAPPQCFGGTPAYMPPEQAAAVAAVRGRRPVPAAVDRRADVYALGALLYELLGGARPGAKARPLRRLNPQVGPALAAAVARCLAADPGRRYPDAGALAADLRRELAHLPLLGVPNRNIWEGWRKWGRRRPHALPRLAAAAVVVLALAAGLTAGAAHVAGRKDAAERALAEGEDQLRRGLPDDAERTLARGAGQLDGLPGFDPLARALAVRRRQALRARLAQDLHRTADALRFTCEPEALSADARGRLRERCGRLWEARAVIVGEPGDGGAPDAEEQVREDLLDLALLWVDSPGAEDVLDQAEALFGPSPAVAYERARRAGVGAAAPRPTTAWEEYAVGRSLLRAGRADEAAGALARAVDLRPQGFWPNFYQGACAYRRGRLAAAEAAFRVCVALAPDAAPCWYNRGLARAALGHRDEARRDYDRAVRLDPGLAAAWLNRGVLEYEIGKYDAALSDFREALARGADPAQGHYDLALTRVARGERDAAREEARAALRARPGHAGAKALLARP